MQAFVFRPTPHDVQTRRQAFSRSETSTVPSSESGRSEPRANTIQNALSNEALRCLRAPSNSGARLSHAASGRLAQPHTRAGTSPHAGGFVASNDHQIQLEEAVDWDVMERELAEGYQALRDQARVLLRETRLMHDLHVQQGGDTTESRIKDLEALADGRISSVVSVVPQRAARITVRAMEAQPERALDILVEDLAVSVRWLRSQATASNNDPIQEALARRMHIFDAILPQDMQKHILTAFMHLEHEELGRTYVNRETMHRLPVAGIPRASFWVSDDGYAWQMDELAVELIANGGEMRNPVSRRMFLPKDVHAIKAHSMGEGLRSLNS